MIYTNEQYQRLSILHPLIQDALAYAIEEIWASRPKHSILDSLEALYGLTDVEAHVVYDVAVRLRGEKSDTEVLNELNRRLEAKRR